MHFVFEEAPTRHRDRERDFIDAAATSITAISPSNSGYLVNHLRVHLWSTSVPSHTPVGNPTQQSPAMAEVVSRRPGRLETSSASRPVKWQVAFQLAMGQNTLVNLK